MNVIAAHSCQIGVKCRHSDWINKEIPDSSFGFGRYGLTAAHGLYGSIRKLVILWRN
jgi:hypothetical protein